MDMYPDFLLGTSGTSGGGGGGHWGGTAGQKIIEKIVYKQRKQPTVALTLDTKSRKIYVHHDAMKEQMRKYIKITIKELNIL